MELVGTFTTIDFFVGFSSKFDVFDTSVKVFSESTNSFSFPQSSKNTLSHSGNDGTSPVARSCNALVPELAEDRPLVANVVEAMIFMISGALTPDVGTIFSHAVNI